jgi:hypothetical protein
MRDESADLARPAVRQPSPAAPAPPAEADPESAPPDDELTPGEAAAIDMIVDLVVDDWIMDRGRRMLPEGGS